MKVVCLLIVSIPLATFILLFCAANISIFPVSTKRITTFYPLSTKCMDNKCKNCTSLEKKLPEQSKTATAVLTMHRNAFSFQLSDSTYKIQ